jgi:hypothetical protein
VKNLSLGSVSIPITQFASQGNAILGIRDSGKSYTATYLGEQLYAAGIPFIAFDPSGVWKFLRVPGKGPGLPIVVAGGKNPDLPLTPQSAPEIVRAAMRANVSLVIDLYDMHLSKADWSRIVEACVRVLLYENGEHGLRHVFIEEGAEFAPQNVTSDKARVYAEVEKLVRIGGNALLGVTLINQRAEQVNKAVLELCDCLFLHRQKGKNSIKSLEKWLELSTGGDTKEIIKGLPQLPSGECWVWPANADHASHVKMPHKNSFHPDRRALIANPAAANVKRIDATKFVTELKGSLEKYLLEAEANDPKALKTRIAELERKISDLSIVDAKFDQPALERAEQEGYLRGHRDGRDAWNRESAPHIEAELISAFDKVIESVKAERSSLIEAFRLTAARIASEPTPVTMPIHPPGVTRSREIVQEIKRTAHLVNKATDQLKKRSTPTMTDGEAMPKAERSILAALASYHPEAMSTSRVSILSGYSSTSSSFHNALSALRTSGYINRGNPVSITTEGLHAIGDNYDPLPTGKALHDYWMQKLDKAERSILAVLLDAYPKPISKESLSSASGYSVSSSSFHNALSKLRTLELMTRGELKASESLF